MTLYIYEPDPEMKPVKRGDNLVITYAGNVYNVKANKVTNGGEWFRSRFGPWFVIGKWLPVNDFHIKGRL